MEFDIYGRFRLQVVRENDRWVAYRTGVGTRAREPGIVIPPDMGHAEIAAYLDDLFHELAGPGEVVRTLSV